MKNVTFGLLLLCSFSSFATTNSPLDLEGGRFKSVLFESAELNSDGSYTVKQPRLIRGNRTHLILHSSTNSMTGVCKAMGFESYLVGSMWAEERSVDERAVLNSEGGLTDLLYQLAHSVKEISCYNGPYKSVVKAEQVLENLDDTVTLVKPRLKRGNSSYPLLSSTALNTEAGVCRAAGFDSYLGLSRTFENRKPTIRATLTKDGEFIEIVGGDFYSIDEITCVKKIKE